MRFIYVDEAGTAANEPVTVVVALIANADEQLLPTIAAVERVLTLVPERYRDRFVFHATAIWNSKMYRPDWGMEERKAFLMAMMEVPRACGVPISYGVIYRDGKINPEADLDGMTPSQYQHAHAFGLCMASADEYVTNFAGPKEMATIVAEDVPEMRKRLEQSVLRLRVGTIVVRKALVTHEVGDGSARTSTKNEQSINLRIRRVVHSIHFAPKESAHLLWAADAVAFGLRRYFSKQSHGLDFGKAVIGPDVGPAERNLDCAGGFFCRERPDAAEPFVVPSSSRR